MAVTKRLSRSITTHYNAGYTRFQKADYYVFDQGTGLPVQTFERDLSMKNLGASLIWQIVPKFNFMLEYSTFFEKEIQEDGSLTDSQLSIINPGFRFALQIGKVQIVPSMGVPLNFEGNKLTSTGGFIYLSIEPDYTK